MAADSLHVLLLAAGGASRFGSAKQAARLDGTPLLRLMLARAQELAGPAVSVVLGAHAAELVPLISGVSASILVNRQWQEGIASSIRLGLERLPGGCDGVLLLLADQVQVGTPDLARLAAAWRRQPLLAAAAQYDGRLGVPAIFPRSAFGTLLQLRGDRGAQGWLRAHAERVAAVPMPRAAIDIDTPEDLARAQALLEQEPSLSAPSAKEISGAEVTRVLGIESP
jgi:CTP:molybdopterin cytidylyltransferase MocA